jgi:hypothetical protein
MIMIARRFSLLRQLAWAATLAVGFGTLWFVVVSLLATWFREAWQGGNWPPQQLLLVRSDGTLLIQSIPHENRTEATLRDLNGRIHEDTGGNNWLPPVDVTGEDPKTGYLSPRSGWDSRLKPFVDEQEPTVNWFFVHDGKPEGAGYFVGYERTSNRRIGFLGMSAFRTDPAPPADWIPVYGEPRSSASLSIYSGHGFSLRPDRWDVPPRWVYVPSGNHLRMVDLAARTITTVFETPEPIVAAGIPWLAALSAGHPAKEQSILVRTTREIVELDQKYHVIKVFTVPTEVDPRSQLQWYEMGNGQAIAIFSPHWSTKEPVNRSRRMVYRIAGDGAIQEQFELDLQTGVPVPNKQTEAFQLAMGLPAPALLVVVDLMIETGIDEVQGYQATLSALLKNSGPALIAVLTWSLILAIMAWRRSRAFGLSRQEQITWAVFVLLFGLSAYAGFLLHRRWPIRLPCPDCHARVPRDRAACAECGTRFPDPSLQGIEIFA